DPGAHGLPLLRRLETLGVRPAEHARPGRRALLHPDENRDPPLAHRHSRRRRLRHADDEVSRAGQRYRWAEAPAGARPARSLQYTLPPFGAAVLSIYRNGH